MLAQEADHAPTGDDPRIQRRRIHVGYYLIDKGFPQLAVADRLSSAACRSSARRSFALTLTISTSPAFRLITIFFIAASSLFPLAHIATLFDCLIAALVLAAAGHAMRGRSGQQHRSLPLFDPEPLPKLDFSKGIPPDCATLVAVPTLLAERKASARPGERISKSASSPIAIPNLHFALLTDLARLSQQAARSRTSHPLVDLAIQLIDELNAKYASPESGAFLLLHRHRIFNTRQGVWMGWERKRGKLLDLNKLLAGEFDAFPIKAGRA